MGVHDKDQYPEIKRLLNIPEEEPIFILRGKDKFALQTIDYYGHSIDIAVRRPELQPFLQDVDNCAAEFQMFAAEHSDRMKVPD